MKISSQLLILLPLVFAIGVLLTLQTAINTQLKEYLYSPIQAAFFPFDWYNSTCRHRAVSVTSQTMLTGADCSPWYLWLGGFLGVYAISMSIYAAPKMGFLTLTGMIIFGQMVMSMIVDHFGLLGNEKCR